ncbi:hypothetical protein [Maribacter hydrothermalis]|uniref:hypothetical protein n=1 Tax=Maribacter hydrothermalis TaxID=1836467 RepID=UPI0012FBEA73|nr:hypothetical protein [Maribacter hydrothermalis]
MLILSIEQQNNRIMEREITSGVKVLNGFLKLMNACLIIILISIPIAALADWIGLFK